MGMCSWRLHTHDSLADSCWSTVQRIGSATAVSSDTDASASSRGALVRTIGTARVDVASVTFEV